MFLACVPIETRTRFSLRENPRERFKLAACMIGVIAGIVTLALGAVRLAAADDADVLVTTPTDEANIVVIEEVSVAFSVVAVLTAFASGFVLLRWRFWSAYVATSMALSCLALAASVVITGLNFWLLEWASSQPSSVVMTHSWEQYTAKTAGFGVVLIVAASVHSVLLLFPDGEGREGNGETGRLGEGM